jgi:YVTN family beta-propeller protein
MYTRLGESSATPASSVQREQEVDAGITMEDRQLNQSIEELQQVYRKTVITAVRIASIVQNEAAQWVAKAEALFRQAMGSTEIIAQTGSQIQVWFAQVNQVVESMKDRLQSMEADLVTFTVTDLIEMKADLVTLAVTDLIEMEADLVTSAGMDLIEVEDLLEAMAKVKSIVTQIDYCQAKMETEQTVMIADTKEASLETDRRLQVAVDELKQAYLEQMSAAVKVAETARAKSTQWVTQQVEKILARAKEPKEPEAVFQRAQTRVEKWLKQVSHVWMVESMSEHPYTISSDMMTVARAAQVIVQSTVEAIMEVKRIFVQIETYQAEMTAKKAARIAGQAEITAQKREAAVILAKIRIVETEIEKAEIEKKEKEAKEAREEANVRTKAAAKAIKAVKSGKFKEKIIEKAIAAEKARRTEKAKVVGVYVLVRDYGNIIGNVIVIDVETNKLTSTIPMERPPCGAAVTPDGSKVYVVCEDNSIIVIDTSTQQVRGTILVGQSPYNVTATSDGSKVHVGNGDNTATQQVKDAISVRQSPCGIAVIPDGSKVYVLNKGSDSNSIIVIDTVTQRVVVTIPVKQPLYGMAIAPDGTQIYAWTRKQTHVWRRDDTSFILQGCDDIIVIDTAMQQVTSTISVGQHPQDMAITLDGSWAYVVNGNNANVSVISTATQQVVGTISVGRYPTNVAVTPDGSRIYVVCEDEITIIDTDRKEVSGAISLAKSSPPLYGYGIAITPDGSRAYVARKDYVIVIDIATNKVLDIIQMNGIPNDIVIAYVIPQVKQT